ncbi:tRNA (N6-isopentenyl adenosine(37)-C2)-methylthiotransferase MiaB [Candidatus Berkelbacteria bacterium CG08_land_8_20_14_0_20_39_8]|uniref:tRNA (N6-isopentenyl adenosine(37)-C2)-methylthiotransferase MiaB n=1 Tax=Candidatus Berkelbacteria bacterium CG08_land_8_20_14_0_20_39_8 TaxID=1974511 RepID=A0A2M6YCY4_9BACT|nr:MAG: tRNA (N6-isopentenyl adenosine(37)-C2)-methylthiotransferase MiaB [Candidatus Berkelbacteria bacterium CG08_land_8_20_14_0_20_39_8]
MNYFIETIGCQQNEYDASRLAIFLKSAGLTESTAQDANVIFILACSVRQTAVDRIYGRVRNWVKDKKVVITSCLMPEDQKKIADRGAFYWQFADTKALYKILKISFDNLKISQSSNSTYVPIMTGCNNFCSYCIVPYTRGREKSRPMQEIIKETFSLIKTRKKKIVLLGQNVNSYKNQASRNKSLSDKSKTKTDFAQLLEKINDLPGDFEVSFMSSHPKDMTEDVIDAIATLPKIKKEIHLPLQSGSDRILKLMNRPYSSKQYLELIKNCKLKIANLAITTDIIVGFPGETESDFQKTVEVCKKAGFALAYINKYSPRKGTAAYKLGDPILWKEKQRRWEILNKEINKKS